jgi:predicted branched-subunit amino acid permease
MHWAMRSVVALNFLLLVILTLTTGSPMPLSRQTFVGSMLGDWWLLSTLMIVATFLLLVARKIRKKRPTPRLWIDGVLFAAWLCAFGLMAAVEAAMLGGLW